MVSCSSAQEGPNDAGTRFLKFWELVFEILGKVFEMLGVPGPGFEISGLVFEILGRETVFEYQVACRATSRTSRATFSSARPLHGPFLTLPEHSWRPGLLSPHVPCIFLLNPIGTWTVY